MASPGIEWIWSGPHQDYYYTSYDDNGNHVYHWSKQSQSQAQPQDTPSQDAQPQDAQPQYNQPQYSQPQYSQPHDTQSGAAMSHHRTDSGLESGDQLAAPAHILRSLPDFIPGTPNRGSYEVLDPSYRMRTRREAHEFFTKGRVFAMLWAEAASETAVLNKIGGEGTVQAFNPSITPGRFGESVYSQIRRFVIVDVRRKDHFVKACPITTYTNRGVTKHGCNAREHTIVYFNGTQPVWYQGEREKGMTKEPIMIVPAESNATMSAASRLRLGRTYPIEWNVKVKDIGMVYHGHISKLLEYWREEDTNDSDDGDTPEYAEGAHMPQYYQNQQDPHQYGQQQANPHYLNGVYSRTQPQPQPSWPYPHGTAQPYNGQQHNSQPYSIPSQYVTSPHTSQPDPMPPYSQP